MNIADYGSLFALTMTYTGNRVIRAFMLWRRMYVDVDFRIANPYIINTIGQLCEESRITSTYSPVYIRALAFMMMAEYHRSNGRDEDAEYCAHVVESIQYSGLTLGKDLIEMCKEVVADI